MSIPDLFLDNASLETMLHEGSKSHESSVVVVRGRSKSEVFSIELSNHSASREAKEMFFGGDWYDMLLLEFLSSISFLRLCSIDHSVTVRCSCVRSYNKVRI